jgi:glyoxylase-like metal-dependent hydrolase (beta-lactamase superfamily II)
VRLLVDLGLGPVTSGTFRGGQLLDGLATLGVSPREIDHVLLTHLHWDHIGWASTAPGVATFAHARYWCGERDWAHFVARGARPQRELAAFEERFGFSEELDLQGVEARPAPGHTPGSFVYTVRDDELAREVWFVGDIIHTLAELASADSPPIGDVDPAQARRTRRRVLAEAARRRAIVAPAHLAGLTGLELESETFPYATTPFVWKSA